MIHFFGDVHGDAVTFNTLLQGIPDSDTVIQVGDFWMPPNVALSRRVDFIAGNHEDWPRLSPYRHAPEPVEVLPRCWYNSQGLVRKIDGKTVAFLGGAESPDREWRTPGLDWWPEESISGIDTDRLYAAVDRLPTAVDLLVTHTPPYSTCERFFGDGYMQTRFQHSSKWVELAWEHCGRPLLVCGHLHPDRVYRDRNVVVLPIMGHFTSM